MSNESEEIQLRVEHARNCIEKAEKACALGMTYLLHTHAKLAADSLRDAIYELETAALIGKTFADEKRAEYGRDALREQTEKEKANATAA